MGSTVGGQLVAITGADFSEGMAVLFDGVPATDVTVMSSAVVTAVTPPHPE
ncbi:MAG: cell shape-determining protein, partial [Actinobacteria bacterium]|nr:cell shape-determining protein [Actinomycetota bacterium]